MFQVIAFSLLELLHFHNTTLIYVDCLKFLFTVLGAFQPNLKIAVTAIMFVSLSGLVLFYDSLYTIIVLSLFECVEVVNIFVTPALLLLGCTCISHLINSYPQIFEIVIPLHFLLLFSLHDQYVRYYR